MTIAHPKVDANDKIYPMERIITASVHDASLLSGKNEEASSPGCSAGPSMPAAAAPWAPIR
jgi:hypothetical protein